MVAREWRMATGYIRKWRYQGMPRRYAAHLRVKGLAAGSSSDLQGCKPSRSLLILLNLHPPSLLPPPPLSLSSRFSARSSRLITRRAAASIIFFRLDWLLNRWHKLLRSGYLGWMVDGSPLVYDRFLGTIAR